MPSYMRPVSSRVHSIISNLSSEPDSLLVVSSWRRRNKKPTACLEVRNACSVHLLSRLLLSLSGCQLLVWLFPVTPILSCLPCNLCLPLRFQGPPSAVLRTDCEWQGRNIPSCPCLLGVSSAAQVEEQRNVEMALQSERVIFPAAPLGLLPECVQLSFMLL